MSNPATEQELNKNAAAEFRNKINLEIAQGEKGIYDDDDGYHAFFQQLFRVDVAKAEAVDEYDEEIVTEGMRVIYAVTTLSESTGEEEKWRQLYVTAAGLFLSEDPEVGLPVLLSYSYLPLFYRLLQAFDRGDCVAFDALYAELLRKLTEK